MTTLSAVLVRSGVTRAALMLPAGLALLTGLDAGLLLLGVGAPVRLDRLGAVHGMLMVFGFVGTLISLERAVALRRAWGLSSPLLFGVGSVLLLTPLPLEVGKTLLVGGGAAMVAVYVPLWRRQRDDAVVVQAFGAVLGTGAALLWLGGISMPTLLPWLAGYVILTIAGERLELARMEMGPGAGNVLVLLSGAVTAGVVASLLWPAAGTPLLGLALLVLTGWLALHDVAKRTIRAPGAPGFIAVCMLAGYAWLVVASGVWLVGATTHGGQGAHTDGSGYDAVVHAVFLGFTISMIMAHATTILPAVLRRPLPWHPVMWGPVVLLHAGLVVRVWLGDGLGHRSLWQLGGVLNVVALLAFVAVAAGSMLRSAGKVTR